MSNKKKDKRDIKIKKGGSITESIIDNLFFLLAFFIGIGVLLYFMKSGFFSLWDTAKEYGEVAKEVAEVAVTKTAEGTKDAVAAGVVAAEPIGKVLGKTNDIISTNPINKTVVSFGTDNNAIKELYNIEKNPETGEYAIQDNDEPSGVQGFVNATFKQLIGVFGFGEEDAISKLKKADEIERIQSADEYFQNPDTSIYSIDTITSSSKGSSTDSSTSSNRIFPSIETPSVIGNSVIIPESEPEPVSNFSTLIQDSPESILKSTPMKEVDLNSYKSIPDISEVDRVEPFLKSAPTILQGKQASILNDEIQNLKSAPTILKNNHNYMEPVDFSSFDNSLKSDTSFKSTPDIPEDFETSLSKTRRPTGVKTLGGSSNAYGPKKITIYKILGLLLLSLYLEHYNK